VPFELGPGELILILAVVVLFFGPRRIPEAGAALGRSIREFRRAVSGTGEEFPPPPSAVPATPREPAAEATPSPPAAG